VKIGEQDSFETDVEALEGLLGLLKKKGKIN
jgi:hypothetical protein